MSSSCPSFERGAQWVNLEVELVAIATAAAAGVRRGAKGELLVVLVHVRCDVRLLLIVIKVAINNLKCLVVDLDVLVTLQVFDLVKSCGRGRKKERVVRN